MKHFTYTNLNDYLKIADAHEDVKTIKIVEELKHLNGNSPCIGVRAVTYLRTALIQWVLYEDRKGKREDLIRDLKKHHHAPGMMREVAPLKL